MEQTVSEQGRHKSSINPGLLEVGGGALVDGFICPGAGCVATASGSQ